MKKLFFLLLPMLAAAWLAGLHGCKKCHAAGRVLEFSTDKPIPNATVSLTECEGEVLGSLNCFATATAVTDANGEVAFDKTGFALAAEATGYWPTGDDFVQFTSECPDPVTVRLFPEAWLEVTIRNESGAYSFGSGQLDALNRYYLQSGQEKVFTKKVRGNSDFKLLFSIQQVEGDTLPTNLTNVKIKDEQGGLIQASFENSFSPWFKVFSVGHLTTKITLIY